MKLETGKVRRRGVRKKALRILVFAVVVGITAAVGWCGAGEGSAVTVTDKLGNRVEIPVPVKRAVLLSLYELMPVLDLWDNVIGLNRWAFDNTVLKRCPRLEGIPVVGTGIEVNAEAIMALHPELVITWSYRPEVVEFLTRKGLRVIAVYPDSLEELYEVIEMCGGGFSGKKAERKRSAPAWTRCSPWCKQGFPASRPSGGPGSFGSGKSPRG